MSNNLSITNQEQNKLALNSQIDLSVNYTNILRNKLKQGQGLSQLEKENQIYKRNVIGVVDIIKAEKLIPDVLNDYEKTCFAEKELEDKIASNTDALNRLMDSILVEEDAEKIATLKNKIDLLKEDIVDKQKQKNEKMNLKLRLQNQLGITEMFKEISKNNKSDDSMGAFLAGLNAKTQTDGGKTEAIIQAETKTVRVKSKSKIEEDLASEF